MSFAAFVGFAMMILITTLLLKKKVSTLFAFTIIPIIGAFLLGANVKEVCDYVKFGLGKTRDLMFIIFFSLPYFSLMNEVGLFDTMVEFLLKRTKLSVTIVMIITVFVSLITEIDGSGTSTYLVTVPMMLPLYKKLKIDPKCLLLLCSATMCALFITPWNGRTLRAATLLDGIPAPQNYIFVHMLPLMLIYIAMCLGLAVLLARFQMKKGAGQVDESVIMEDLEKK